MESGLLENPLYSLRFFLRKNENNFDIGKKKLPCIIRQQTFRILTLEIYTVNRFYISLTEFLVVRS